MKTGFSYKYAGKVEGRNQHYLTTEHRMAEKVSKGRRRPTHVHPLLARDWLDSRALQHCCGITGSCGLISMFSLGLVFVPYLSIKCTPDAVSTMVLMSPGFNAKAASSNSFCICPLPK